MKLPIVDFSRCIGFSHRSSYSFDTKPMGTYCFWSVALMLPTFCNVAKRKGAINVWITILIFMMTIILAVRSYRYF